MPWRRTWQTTPVFLFGEFHRQRSLVGYSPWGHTESDMTEYTHTHTHTHTHIFPLAIIMGQSTINSLHRILVMAYEFDGRETYCNFSHVIPATVRCTIVL